MKISRVTICSVVCLALLGSAWAEVRTLSTTQELEVPNDPTYQYFRLFGKDVAIHGDAIIVLTEHATGQSALLYRREGSNGPWSYRRTLLTVGQSHLRAQVRMKNGLAAVQFGDRVWLFEYNDGNYRVAQTASPIRHPGGIAISGNSILIGGDNCDYDAVVYQKGSDGLWGVTGRMDDNQGECLPGGLAVDLNYDYALLRVPGTNQVTTWRRNGTALDWVPAGSLEIPPALGFSERPLALQGSTAVTPDFPAIIRRSGTTWTPTGVVRPIDDANASTTLGEVTYRDGVLLINEYGLLTNPRMSAYIETSAGKFEHVAILHAPFLVLENDLSGRTAVVAGEFAQYNRHVYVHDLPSPLLAPPAIANDFEERDLSDFTFDVGAFALATRGTNDVLARTEFNRLAFALVNGSEWTNQQRIEADIATAFSSSAGRAGLVVRYIDANNYYFLAQRPGGILRLYRMQDGVETVLWQRATGTRLPVRVGLAADGTGIYVYFNDVQVGSAYVDRELRPGRAGLATFQTRTDFDNVYVTAIPAPLSLMEQDFRGWDWYRSDPFTQIGGDWRVIWDGVPTTSTGIAQLDASGSALAFNGVPVRNQKIAALARFNTFNSPPQDAWFGLLARYVDTQTYYYVSMRSTNRIDIRKKVNGVITVLATASFTPVPERDYQLRFNVIDDQLQAYVDGVLVASAHDDEIESGQYGIATFRATALWRYIGAFQP